MKHPLMKHGSEGAEGAGTGTHFAHHLVLVPHDKPCSQTAATLWPHLVLSPGGDLALVADASYLLQPRTIEPVEGMPTSVGQGG